MNNEFSYYQSEGMRLNVSFFFQINFYFIEKEGHHEEAWAILYYITMLWVFKY